MKALEGDAVSMLFRRGIRANHATNERRPGGKASVNRTPDRIARSKLRNEGEAGLVVAIMQIGHIESETSGSPSPGEPGSSLREIRTFSIFLWSPFLIIISMSWNDTFSLTSGILPMR